MILFKLHHDLHLQLSIWPLWRYVDWKYTKDYRNKRRQLISQIHCRKNSHWETGTSGFHFERTLERAQVTTRQIIFEYERPYSYSKYTEKPEWTSGFLFLYVSGSPEETEMETQRKFITNSVVWWFTHCLTVRKGIKRKWKCQMNKCGASVCGDPPVNNGAAENIVDLLRYHKRDLFDLLVVGFNCASIRTYSKYCFDNTKGQKSPRYIK